MQSGNGQPSVSPVDHTQLLEIIRQHIGQPVLVNVWATWCDPCREEMPNLVKLRQNYSAQGLSVILVSADDVDKADSVVRPTLIKLGVDFPSYIEQDSSDDAFIGAIDSTWSGALPATFIYDAKGNLVKTLTGGKKYEEFEAVVKKLMN